MIYPGASAISAESRPEEDLLYNINSITVDIMLKVQKDIAPCDMVSLVFLLYDTPDTALQKLIVYQTVSKDVETNNMDLLYDWALYSKDRPTWKNEFLEALTICRLYNVIRKLGFNVSNIKEHYLPENISVNIYIDPMKKVLYRLCESMTKDYLTRLKITLKSINKDVLKYDTAELIFLNLMCQKFIELGHYNNEEKLYTNTYNVESLAETLDSFGDLSKYATILRQVQNQINSQNGREQSQVNNKLVTELRSTLNSGKAQTSMNNESFSEICEPFSQLNLRKEPVQNLETDATKQQKDCYIIKNKNRIGVCCIINQEKFYPSKDTIKTKSYLSDRLGSTVDLTALERTMRAIKFVVKSKSNLDHMQVFEFIKDVVQNDIQSDDSVFMLCILSHGVKGHVCAADSVKIKVHDIQNYLDSNDCRKLRDMPKVLILQACQVEEHQDENERLVADEPNSHFYFKKSHFLIYWATAPELEAYRLEDKGSFFIQCLCVEIEKRVKKEPLFDIFTEVTDHVMRLCSIRKQVQVPLFESTLRKKLFLHPVQ